MVVLLPAFLTQGEQPLSFSPQQILTIYVFLYSYSLCIYKLVNIPLQSYSTHNIFSSIEISYSCIFSQKGCNSLTRLLLSKSLLFIFTLDAIQGFCNHSKHTLGYTSYLMKNIRNTFSGKMFFCMCILLFFS